VTGRGAQGRGAASARGFTLVELIIAVALMAVLTAAAIPAVAAVTGANARSAAGELAGAARYLFDVSSLRHEPCRLVLDLDERAWWAECTKDRTAAARDAAGADPGLAEDDDRLAGRVPDDVDVEARRVLARAKWAQFSDSIAKKRGLPGGAAFRDVRAEHLREPATRGRAYVYFWPQGRAEEASIVVADGDHVYSVLVPGYTGRARVVSGKPEARR
jgi:general secretion pathway protein H